ncbi:MAG TPA: hypothetical protein VN668_02280 [Stellaceae bacterium]|nr:hypothetical protein [Stellaceae bacterium]
MADGGGSPASLILDRHLHSARFLAGEEEGRWRVLKLVWPHLYVRVAGKDPAGDVTCEHDFHIECTDYPETVPFVERWAYADGESCGSRPSAPVEGAPGFVDALKEWSPGNGVHGGIYRAWQRHAAAHNDWAAKRRDEAWNRDRELSFIMERLYVLLSEQAIWMARRVQA